MINVFKCRAQVDMRAGDRVKIVNPVKTFAIPITSMFCFPMDAQVDHDWDVVISEGRLQADCKKGSEANLIVGILPNWLKEVELC